MFPYFSRFHLTMSRLCAMVASGAFLFLTCNVVAQEADLVFVSGVIYTMDEEQPKVEAMAISKDRIVAVGTNAEMKEWIGDETKVIDLESKTIVPGFIESHGHLLGLGSLLMELNLTEATSWGEIVRLVEDAASRAEPGEWIIGRGWHQSLWDEKPVPDYDGYPTHQALSAVSPNNPVLLVHRSGHMSLANDKAMAEAGVSHSTKDPSGGEILRNETGNPIGVFRETAQGLIRQAHGKSRENMEVGELKLEFDRQVTLAEQECLKKGITTFVDAGSGASTVQRIAQRIENGQLDLRLWFMLRTSNAALRRDIPELKKYQGYGNHHLTVGGIKQMVDGALGAHGAWLLEPYTDLEESTGLVVTPVETIRETAEIALEHELQLCVHAIGDRANREMLDLFESFVARSKEEDAERELRWRIEHAQHIHPDDIPRFAELGVIASMQAIHCTSDGPFVPERLGPLRSSNGAYVWQSLLESGAVVANGTDAPVEPIDPIACFYASVTRMMRNGSPFFPQQAMTREQALRSYTLDAAYAIFEEDLKGSLRPGKLADLVVLSQDIMKVDEDEIGQTEVEMTVIGGQIVFER